MKNCHSTPRHELRSLLLPILGAAALVSCPAVSTAQDQSQKSSFDDSAIREAVERNLYYADSVSTNWVDVEVKDGVVTLKGTAADLLGQDRAVQVAESVKGVRDVVSNLEVDPQPNLDPAKLQENLEQALAQNPIPEANEINLDVDSFPPQRSSLPSAQRSPALPEMVRRLLPRSRKEP